MDPAVSRVEISLLHLQIDDDFCRNEKSQKVPQSNISTPHCFISKLKDSIT